MTTHSTLHLATVIALPIVTIILLWTLIIYHKNRRAWQSYDIPIVAIVYISTIRNLSIGGYIILRTLDYAEIIRNSCSAFIWLLNSLHTFQATCLTTLAVIGLFSIKLYGKRRSLKLYLTPSHVIYHLFCLTALCACVGIAALLAQGEQYLLKECRFMPYDLDVKFNVFIIVLHLFLLITSTSATITVALYYCKLKAKHGFDYIKKSTSDLSDLSSFDNNVDVGNKLVHADGKGFYDTYTIQRNGGNQFGGDQNLYTTIRHNGFQGNFTGNWYVDPSNVSTTVSSTNSRRPLNGQQIVKEDRIRTGLGTIHPILAVCYLFYHIPVVVLSIFPSLVYPWDVPLLGLWLGLLQDILIPVSLGLMDSRFCEWVSKVYRCGERGKCQDKVPHVGLDGKFRHFGSQPQSLEITQLSPRNVPVEHKFPITNGSLYTSIDGRPFIHNYRRPKTLAQAKSTSGALPLQQANMKCLQIRENLEAQQRCLMKYQNVYDYTNVPSPQQCGSRTSLQFDPSLDTIRQNLVALRQKNNLKNIQDNVNATYVVPERNPDDFNVGLKRFNRTNLRLSKSQDSLNDIQNDLTKFKELVRVGNVTKVVLNKESSVDSDEEFAEITIGQNFDTLSSESSYSITTEANGDFEFYNDFNRMQQPADKLKITLPPSIEESRTGMSGSYLYLNDSKKIPSLQQTSLSYYNQPVADWSNDSKATTTTTKKSSRNNSLSDVSDLGYQFKIKRSNSKRSLENFQAYLDESSYTTVANFNNVNRLQKANSFVTLEEKYKNNYINNYQNHNSIRHEDFVSSFLVNNNKYSNRNTNYVGSVPDLKKVFISEYI